MVLKQVVKLNTGAEMPVLGFGTWQSSPGEVREAVKIALEAGYRHIDTATAYENEKEVGEGIKLSGVPREKIYLTTKLNPTDMRNPKAALEYSLKQLDTPYLDLWLLHWPAPMTKDYKPDKEIDWLDVYKEVEKIYRENPNKIKAIGVSNWSVSYLERLLKHATVVPAINQIELHPSCPQTELVKFSLSKGIAVTAYSPLGSTGTPLAKNEVVKKVAERKGVSPHTVLISLWANKDQISVLSKSVTPERIRANTKLVDLSDEEVDELLAINKTNHFRCCPPGWTGYGSLGFPDCE
ncbi:Aldo/keto reductase [Thelephora ganbajun]|uniref:Aldo/keto reductase n=1 Tax=Thelephora ganbajun TaxID=370292 RepID=A0ACB6ZS57_THEGA|nr:Aldo/keto reductase [Thelephora ganbajun]